MVWLDAENFAGLLVQETEVDSDVVQDTATNDPVDSSSEDVLINKDHVVEDTSEDEDDNDHNPAGEKSVAWDSYDINLSNIKKSVKSIRYKSSMAKKDRYLEENEYNSYGDNSDDEELHTSRKKSGKSIHELLDSFDEDRHHREEHQEEIVQQDDVRENVGEIADPNLVQQWNLMAHLPDSARLHFKYIICKF